MTSVLESTFSVWPATVSVLLDLSKRSTEPCSSVELLPVESVVDAVALEVSDEPVVPVLVLDIEPEVSDPVALPVDDGLVLVLLPVLPDVP